MILLRLISWQYIRKHLLRTFLTLVGIALGVAVFVGMHTANQSVLFAFQKTIDRIAGATQLQVTGGEMGFGEQVLERVQAIPDVRVAVPIIEAPVNTGRQGEGNLLILGVDMTGDRSLRNYDLEGSDDVIDDPLVFLAQPDSLIVTRPFAERNNLRTGDKIPLSTMEGEKTFTVRGIMSSGGLTSAFGGNVAVMDVYAAQKMFGRGRRFDRIDLAVKEGEDVDAVRNKLDGLLGPGFQVDTPGSRGRQFEAIATVFRMSANITSLFALFIGMFIIYNTFAIAVTQRRTEIGILRALGATQRQIRALFLSESAAAGLVASIVGAIAGMGIARAIAGSIGGMMGEVYGLAEHASQVSADPRLVGTAVLIGICTSVIAGWLPARSAARVDPVKALQKGRQQALTAGESRVRRIVAIACGSVALSCFAIGQAGVLLYTGYLFAIFAAVLFAPAATLWLSRAIRPVLKQIRPVEGSLAADSLVQAPRRTSGVVAALMLSIGLVISLGGLAAASYSGIQRWLRNVLNPDLFVTTSQTITQRAYKFPESLGQEIAAIDGIADTQFVHSPRIFVDGGPVMLVSTELAKLRTHTRPIVVSGDVDEMYRTAGEGKAVIVSDVFARLRHKHVGDSVDLPTPGGPVRMPIIGVVVDYSDQQGSILIDRSLYKKLWNDSTIDIIRIYVKRGVPPLDVRQRILNRFGKQTRLFVLTNAELRAFIIRLTDQWFGLTYVQIAVAVLVAILGIVNTLTVSITDRRRELGVLRAVGAVRNQIRHTVWMESLAIGFLGLVLGLCLGALQLYYSLQITTRDIAGLSLGYTYPMTDALILVPVILGAALLSALGPAESAVRGSLVEALEYE